MEESRDASRVLVEKPEGKRPLERPRRRRADDIKMGFREMGWRTWIEFIWLMMGTGGGLLRVR
jgi:hypothetical protein